MEGLQQQLESVGTESGNAAFARSLRATLLSEQPRPEPDTPDEWQSLAMMRRLHWLIVMEAGKPADFADVCLQARRPIVGRLDVRLLLELGEIGSLCQLPVGTRPDNVAARLDGVRGGIDALGKHLPFKAHCLYALRYQCVGDHAMGVGNFGRAVQAFDRGANVCTELSDAWGCALLRFSAVYARLSDAIARSASDGDYASRADAPDAVLHITAGTSEQVAAAYPEGKRPEEVVRLPSMLDKLELVRTTAVGLAQLCAKAQGDLEREEELERGLAALQSSDAAEVQSALEFAQALKLRACYELRRYQRGTADEKAKRLAQDQAEAKKVLEDVGLAQQVLEAERAQLVPSLRMAERIGEAQSMWSLRCKVPIELLIGQFWAGVWLRREHPDALPDADSYYRHLCAVEAHGPECCGRLRLALKLIHAIKHMMDPGQDETRKTSYSKAEEVVGDDDFSWLSSAHQATAHYLLGLTASDDVTAKRHLRDALVVQGAYQVHALAREELSSLGG